MPLYAARARMIDILFYFQEQCNKAVHVRFNVKKYKGKLLFIIIAYTLEF